MTDTFTRNFSRIALIVAAIVAIVAVTLRVSRDAVPATAPAATAEGVDPAVAVAQLEAKLKRDPNDVEGWRALGFAFASTGRYGDAATAYRRAVTLNARDADLWSALGEALVMGNQSPTFPAEARAAFQKTRELRPTDPRARYFAGVEKDMGGNHAGALDLWFALLADTPPGAGWEANLRATIEQVAARNKIDVAARLAAAGRGAPAAPGPNAQQAAAVQALPAEQQQAMVANMVETLAAKLKTDPSNVEGWVMLIRSRAMLGQQAEAKAALRDAVAANPGAAAQINAEAKSLGL